MKIQKLCVIIGMALSLASCKNDNVVEDSSVMPAANIGVVVSSIDSNPFFQGMHKSFQAVSQENSQLKVQLEASKDDQNLQRTQIDSMLNNGAKALVVNLADASIGAQFANEMCTRNVPVVYINRSPGNAALQKCKTAFFVGSDDEQGGILQAQLVLENWRNHPEWDKNKDGKIQYAMLEGNYAIASAKLRANWASQSLKFYPQLGLGSENVEAIFSETAKYNGDIAKEVVSRWAATPEFEQVEVILAGNDNMALGAADALESVGKKVPIFGIDAVPRALEAQQQGRIFATIANDYDTQSRIAVRMAANLANNRPVMQGLDAIDLDDNRNVRVRLKRVSNQ